MLAVISDRDLHQITSLALEAQTALDNINLILNTAQTLQFEKSEPMAKAEKPARIVSKPRRKSRAILNTKKVMEIKQRLGKGDKPAELSKLFKVHVTTINAIKYGKTWNHVKLPQEVA